MFFRDVWKAHGLFFPIRFSAVCFMLCLRLSLSHLFSLGNNALFIPKSSVNIHSSNRKSPDEQSNSFLDQSGACILYKRTKYVMQQQFKVQSFFSLQIKIKQMLHFVGLQVWFQKADA
ncbi:hypothetical protein ILYODFUR_017181 [Ilyodon furcidens]|uniref:Secreted protein n=1 Tax=Ilyodon furcidens TaxID=33524 RepID=A0ABV0TKH7_9TELE